MKKVSAILMSDVHLQETVPVCRLDDFEKTQWKKLLFIKKLQMEHDCPVLCGGDLYNHWKPSPELISKTIKYLPKDFITIYGQHDLPQHSLELQSKCGTYTLEKAHALKILMGFHWGMKPNGKTKSFGIQLENSNKVIAVWHYFTYKGKLPWFGYKGPTAKTILQKYPQFDLILTGDNHQTFTEEYNGRLLVNPGSMLRTTAAQINHRPCVFLWYAKTNTVEQVFIPIEEGVISRAHLESTEKRNERIDAFISYLKTDFEIGLSVEKNIELFYQNNRIRGNVKKIISKSLE
jgi:DNA repair exonuclease SbcCD nuclease subunit